MKTTSTFAVLGTILGLSAVSGFAAEAPDCFKASEAVKVAVAAKPSKVLELVETHVAANEKCACEIVRAAIVASEADKNLVASIVTSAANAAPSEARLIAQCAIAVAPDAVNEVQAVMAKFDLGQGDSVVVSEKGGLEKGGVEPAPAINDPLDFPVGPNGTGPTNPVGGLVGPGPNAPGGPQSALPPGFPLAGQPIVVSPSDPLTGPDVSFISDDD